MDGKVQQEQWIQALERCYDVHNKLGEKGLEFEDRTHMSGNTLRGDLYCEREIVNALDHSGLPIRVRSEEHGNFDMGNSAPEFFALIDGMDGTDDYKLFQKGDAPNARHSTMFGFFQGDDPTYEEYLFSGVVEHRTGEMYYATQGDGAFVRSIDGKFRERKLSSMDTKSLDHKMLIWCDSVFDPWAGITVLHDTFLSKLEGYNVLQEGASSQPYVDVANGRAGLGLEVTRGSAAMKFSPMPKDNFEPGIGYGLVREGKGVMIDIEGNDIGQYTYSKWGQGKGEHFPIIAAANKYVAEDFLDHVAKN